MYLINVLVYKIIVYKDNRIVVILNTGGDEGPTELESTVRLLVGSDRHFINILNTMNLDDFEFELYRIQRHRNPRK